MLSPHERSALFDALRPPTGYALDHAVGTSFTLDLEALLTAPIAFALFEARDGDQTEPDVEPVGLLEAIRRHAEHLTVFCQSGQIAVPKRHRTVFAWLEESVIEVPAPRPHHLFHPKVWVARYTENGGGRHVIRVLCATRNLTFDTSWDTLLRLESEPYVARPSSIVDGQAPIARFLRRLTTMALSGTVAQARSKAIRDLADDLEAVVLVPPEPFTSVRFHVLGVEGGQSSVFPPVSERALVISPFLTEPFLRRFVGEHDVVALISREESLDRIPTAVLDRIGRVATINSAADIDPRQGEPGGDPAPTRADDAGDPSRLLGGLHAKLYIFDTALGATVFTGSANGTQAGFGGNVEIIVELEGPQEVGVGALLTDSPGETGFDDLLVDYLPCELPVVESELERLELDLDDLRRQLAGRLFTATADIADDHFRLTFECKDPVPHFAADEIELTVRPVTLAEDQSATRLESGSAVSAEFGVTLEGITAFFAVRATARRGAEKATTAFLVTAVLIGAPPDRHSRLLAGMLRDPERLLRYLLLLLADADPLLGEAGTTGSARWLSRWAGAAWDEVPLLEVLVRAVDRFPDRLDLIDRLLCDLGDQRDEVLPAGFDELWQPIWESREAART